MVLGLGRVTKKWKSSVFVIGLLFVILGIAAKGAASWLFVVSGLLFILQGLYDKFKTNKQSSVVK